MSKVNEHTIIDDLGMMATYNRPIMTHAFFKYTHNRSWVLMQFTSHNPNWVGRRNLDEFPWHVGRPCCTSSRLASRYKEGTQEASCSLMTKIMTWEIDGVMTMGWFMRWFHDDLLVIPWENHLQMAHFPPGKKWLHEPNTDLGVRYFRQSVETQGWKTT